MPKYTFLLPAFKGRFLNEMLRSIQSQTYTNFKVIISDDCSPEDLRSICEPYLSDPRFTYRRNEENMGSKSLVAHWNLLVDMCDTEYLIMASDDDIYAPNYLEEIDILIQKYPYVDLIRGRMGVFDNELHEIKQDRYFPEYVSHIGFISHHFAKGMCKCMANFTFKTAALKNVGGIINMPLAWFSDEMTSLMLARNGCVNTNMIVFHFRVSGINISNSTPNPQTAKNKAIATLKAEQWLKEFFDKIIKETDDQDKVAELTQLRKKGCKIWRELIYEWLNEVSILDAVCLIPQVLIRGNWNRRMMIPVIRHQLKKALYFKTTK